MSDARSALPGLPPVSRIRLFGPPNAILLAALLLAPRKRWWAIFLAVLPVHMFRSLENRSAGVAAFGWFITNSSEALSEPIALLDSLIPQKRLDSVRGVLVFLAFGALFAPLATSFLGLPLPWLYGMGRTLLATRDAAILDQCISRADNCPTVVLCSPKDLSSTRRISASRWGEAALLAVATVLLRSSYSACKPVSPATAPAFCYALSHVFLWAAGRLVWVGLSDVSLIARADLDLVHNARTTTVPARLPARPTSCPCQNSNFVWSLCR